MPSQAIVIKIGGSALDAEHEPPEPRYLEAIKPVLYDLLDDHQLVVTTGGGPAWDPRKNWRVKYGTPLPLFQQLAVETLRANALEIREVLGDRAVLMHPSDLVSAVEEPRLGEMVVTYSCPESWALERGCPPEYSDSQTLAIADEFGADLCVFLKRAKGMYEWDPSLCVPRVDTLLGWELAPGVADQLREIRARLADRKPRHIDRVTTSRLRAPESGIYRVGADGHDDHLIETHAIGFFAENCAAVKQIAVCDVREPDVLADAFRAVSSGHALPNGASYTVIDR